MDYRRARAFQDLRLNQARMQREQDELRAQAAQSSKADAKKLSDRVKGVFASVRRLNERPAH